MALIQDFHRVAAAGAAATKLSLGPCNLNAPSSGQRLAASVACFYLLQAFPLTLLRSK